MTFDYNRGVLCAESVSLEDVAREFGTPCYVYSRAAIEQSFDRFVASMSGRAGLVCYSVKANSSLAVLSLLAKRGAGFDIVSGGELARVIAAGGDPRRVLFSGVGKSETELKAAIEARVMCINLESEGELARVAQVAGSLGIRAPIAFRVNPDVDARTHPYISTGLKTNKFGVAYDDAETLYARAASMPEVEVVGLGCHIGSQLVSAAPFIDAAARIAALAERLTDAGIRLQHVDLGGGFGIRYRDEQPAPVNSFIDGALGALAGRPETLVVDPGRAVVGNAGILLTRIEYVKRGAEKNFLIVDAAMNDLLRPSLYGAWHDVRPVRQDGSESERVYDVVGPVCESGDFLAQDRPLRAGQGDLLAIMSAGAYGMSMSSNYNSRPRAAEVMVDGGSARLVRRREQVADLFAGETVPAW